MDFAAVLVLRAVGAHGETFHGPGTDEKTIKPHLAGAVGGRAVRMQGGEEG